MEDKNTFVNDHIGCIHNCISLNHTSTSNYNCNYIIFLACRVGPLVSSWCMRMEAKHSYFKRAAQIGNCFKNVPYSVARRHQKLLCGYLQGKFFSYEDLECGPCKYINIIYYTSQQFCL